MNILKLTLIFALLGLSALCEAQKLLSFTTSDGNRIDGDLYETTGTHSSIAIIAPGFAQNRSTKVMRAMCQDFALHIDTFCFDFRGTGTSTGRYSFGEYEPLDLEPILAWAKSKYSTVNLIGLSLGAYTAGRAGFLWPQNISKLILISCPTSVEDIVKSGGLFDSFGAFIKNPNEAEMKTDADWFFRWGPIFGEKPNLAHLGPEIGTPVSFLVGEDDHLVLKKLSTEVYDSMAGDKSWDVFPQGGHAEAMFVQNPIAFEQWLLEHIE